MTKKNQPTDAELDSSLSMVFGAARASGRVQNLDAHTRIVENAARNGSKALALIPSLKSALGAKATKHAREEALKGIADLTGEPHQEEPETEPK